MFKFVNVNKLVHKETLKSLAISSQTVSSKLHRKARTDKQVIRLKHLAKQIINSAETTEWLSYSYGELFSRISIKLMVISNQRKLHIVQ